MTAREIVSTLAVLSNSKAVGTDGIFPGIVKFNAIFISGQLTYIFNLSFTQCVFIKFLKDSIVVPIYKGGYHTEPGDNSPISIY